MDSGLVLVRQVSVIGNYNGLNSLHVTVASNISTVITWDYARFICNVKDKKLMN